MKVTGIAHCALYTSRLEETVNFYTMAFDAENLGYFKASNPGCWLKLGDDVLEIFQTEDLGTGCFKHIAIGCDDVDALYAHAIACGGGEMMKPKNITLGLIKPVQARIAFVTGINGEQIELVCMAEA